MKNTHAVGVTENLLCLFVVAVSNVCYSYKEFKWILSIGFTNALLDLSLDLCLTLLAMANS